MTSLSHRIFRSPLFLRFYEERVHGRFLSSFAKEQVDYQSLFTDLERMGSPEQSQDMPGRVLDLGCGTGWFARHLAGIDRYRDAVITGVDISEQAVHVARASAARNLVRCTQLSFVAGDAQQLSSYLAGPVDEVWLCGCLHQMEKPWAVLDEIAAVLAPNGRVFCQTFCRNPRIRSDVDIAVLRRAGHRVFEQDQLVGMVEEAGLRVAAGELKGIVQLLVLVPADRNQDEE